PPGQWSTSERNEPQVSDAPQALERSTLQKKDRAELITIAQAMGGKPGSRAKKADVIDLILELAGVVPGDAEDAPAADDAKKGSGAKGRGASDSTSADADADAASEGSDAPADGDGPSGGDGDDGADGDRPAGGRGGDGDRSGRKGDEKGK